MDELDEPVAPAEADAPLEGPEVRRPSLATGQAAGDRRAACCADGAPVAHAMRTSCASGRRMAAASPDPYTSGWGGQAQGLVHHHLGAVADGQARFANQ